MAPSRSNLRGRFWPALIIVLLVAAVVAFATYRHVSQAKPATAARAHTTAAAANASSPNIESQVEGHAVVEIPLDKQQLIGVVTTKAEMRDLKRDIRAVGQVVVDEERLSDIHTKVEGWLEKLFVNKTGQVVRKGQPLLTIYSPDLVSTQEEYLVALRSRERTKDSPFAEVRRSGDTLLAAARKRLELWDITEGEIARLERTGEVKKALTLYSPATGYVMERMAIEGMRVMPEMTLFRLADLSRVWVDISVYEYEAPFLKVGERAVLTMAAHPGHEIDGRISYVYPTVETMTRTLRARAEFANPGLMLKPGMYADVLVEAPSGRALAVPEEAVLDTGTRDIVYVKEGEGTFVPRELTVGERAAGYYPVLAGLSEGEEVVSSPNFLVDSESRLRAPRPQSAAKKPSAPPSPPAHANHAGH